MPILQSRAIALISAARAFKEGHKYLATTMAEVIRLIHAGQTADIAGILQDAISETAIDPVHYETIATEASHFKIVASRNNRTRRYMQARRAKALGKPFQDNDGEPVILATRAHTTPPAWAESQGPMVQYIDAPNYVPPPETPPTQPHPPGPRPNPMTAPFGALSGDNLLGGEHMFDVPLNYDHNAPAIGVRPTSPPGLSREPGPEAGAPDGSGLSGSPITKP